MHLTSTCCALAARFERHPRRWRERSRCALGGVLLLPQRSVVLYFLELIPPMTERGEGFDPWSSPQTKSPIFSRSGSHAQMSPSSPPGLASALRPPHGADAGVSPVGAWLELEASPWVGHRTAWSRSHVQEPPADDSLPDSAERSRDARGVKHFRAPQPNTVFSKRQ